MAEQAPERTKARPAESKTGPGLLRGWAEILAVVVLLEVGGILGGLTGFIPLVPIGSVALPLLAAWYFLRREGTSWRSLVFGQRLSVRQTLGYAGLAFAAAFTLVPLTQLALSPLGLPEPDYSVFEAVLKDNLVLYLWMLLPVCWGSAAIGEELLVRGFLQHRLTGLTGRRVALVLQALIFALVHFYQGLSGMIQVFVIALVFGAVSQRTRNLLPTILAHGVIDTIGITLFYLGMADLLEF